MKRNYIVFTVTILALILQNGFAQSDPYEEINKRLETPVESKLLWPWEENDLKKGMKMSEMNATYRLAFNDQNKSELAIDFKNFEEMVSAIYFKDQVSGKILAETLEKSISDEFKPVFEQTDGEDIFFMFSNGDKEQEEVYFLASSKEKYELLYFKYKPKTKAKDRLQFQLENILNK
ncbi:hypothetical protein A33Q_4218 [Indibacter alkaliphilus LW1]|jgi:hypothetical protein|uniref:Uncharacterized protein n=1 Tax=Indibacter alkaliphilus (strain CCUG 57479 / KCTC 22604 / LW1) TaxID=1189612 RepID=S2D4Z9_INDAL|nr:hypothetical protein [Indibacter alkaliphilus]EOZ92125.1 hypothetical protein A33Q_4218 [Indibacter alkaliphilus LW1]